MKGEHQLLLGALIGLARATDGNEHLINPSATAVIRRCLTAVHTDSGDFTGLMEAVKEEKRKMVPNCFCCANPCGRTDDCDFSAFGPGENRQRRFDLLELLCRRAAENPDLPENSLYRCLIGAGMADYTVEDLESLMQELS